MSCLRIGQGYDLHRLVPDRPLILGGCRIPHPQGYGLDGHSDADVLIHAIIDAFLGALALGDIGQHFPDTDDRWLGADSRELLKTTLALPEFNNSHLVNLDATVIAQKPKLAAHIPAIRESLAALLGCPVADISIKAKTNEHLDAIGRGEAIAVHAVLLLEHELPHIA